MKYNIYALHDDLIGYLNICLDQNDEVAKRNFATACKRPECAMFANPNDFKLFCVGTFDSESGENVPCIPRLVSQATDFLKEVSNG